MAVFECQSTSTKYQYRQVKEIDRALGTMRKYGILESDPAYLKLSGIRGKLMGQVGFKAPRPKSLLFKLIGLSPGTVSLWHDAESGFMSEARAFPGALPVYKAISDEVAMAILKHEVTKELEAELMAPDEYLGE